MSTRTTEQSSPADEARRPARHWLAAEILLLVALLLYLGFGDVPERTRFWYALFDAGHAPLFGVIALVVRRLVSRADRSSGRVRVTAIAFVATLALAAAGEVFQLFQASREVSLADFLRGGAGAGAFLLLAAAADRGREAGSTPRRTTAGRLLAVLTAMVLLAATVGELAFTSAIYFARRRAFPTLFALDGSWWERRLIATGRNNLTPGRAPAAIDSAPDAADATPGASGAAAGTVGAAAAQLTRLDLRPGLYPGLTFDEPYPDWRGYQRLVFTVVSDLSAPLELTIRVHDARHDQRYADRFNRRLTIVPGANRIAIPIDDIRRAPDRREMDLGRIRGIVLFAYRLRQPAHLYLGPLRLE